MNQTSERSVLGVNATRVVREEAYQLAQDPNVRSIVQRRIERATHLTGRALEESAEGAVMRMYPMRYSVAAVKQAVHLICAESLATESSEQNIVRLFTPDAKMD